MIDRIDPPLVGFDEAVLERWGLKPTAKDVLNRAKEIGAITPQEISEMVSTALAKDRNKMAEVLQEIKKILQNLNITVTFNVVHTHTHIVQSPTIAPATPAPKPKPQPKVEEQSVPRLATAKGAQYAGQGHESPFLNAKILQEHGLKPEALGVLLAAKDKGCISPQQIGALILAEISQDSEKLRPTMRWITQLLSGLNIKIVIGEVHYKKPESRSPVTSYSRRPEETAVNKSKLNAVLFNSTGLSDKPSSDEPSQEALLGVEKDSETNTEEDEFADPNDEFVPKFIFDRESGVTNPYYRAVKDHKFLKHQDLLELARRWQMHGDYEARNTIVVHNLRLSMKIASHYMGRGLDYDDLVQEGNIGLMIAVERFDPEKGFHFTTYATWWVRQHMQRAIQNFKDIVRMPVHAQEALSKMLKVTCDLASELQREPTLEEVASKAGEDVDKVKEILHQLKIPVVSLEELAYASSSRDSNETTVGDMIVDNCFPSAVTALEAKEDLERASLTIRTLLANVRALPMPEKPKMAFKMYYGLEGYPEGATLESIAGTSGFGVTRERIRQMNAKVWEKLAEHGISMNDEKLVAALKRVHDLENIVSAEADLSPLTEAMVLQEISTAFQNPNGDDGELVPADSVTISRRPKANLEKVVPGTLATEDIIRVVGEAYGVTPEVILGDSKPKDVVWVRWICTYILREKLELSFPKIGQILHYSEHSVTMYGYRQLVSSMERDPSIKDEIEKIIALCGLEKAENSAGTSNKTKENKNFSPIIEQVLELTCKTFGAEKKDLFQKFVRSLDPVVVRAYSARQVAIYLLRTDFNLQIQEIASLFGLNCASNVSVIYNDMVGHVESSADLQSQLTLIRSQYSLEIYGENLEEIKRCQKRLFPKQVEELKSIVEKVVTPFKEGIQRLHAKLNALDVPDRHKEIFMFRFAGDLTKKTPTHEALGQTYDISKQRVNQILETTIERLTPTLDPSDSQLVMDYTQEFEKVRLVVELQNL